MAIWAKSLWRLATKHLKQQLKDKLIEHKHYVDKHGKDMPEILNWKWKAENSKK